MQRWAQGAPPHARESGRRAARLGFAVVAALTISACTAGPTSIDPDMAVDTGGPQGGGDEGSGGGVEGEASGADDGSSPDVGAASGASATGDTDTGGDGDEGGGGGGTEETGDGDGDGDGALCGDGVVQDGEDCDDGNAVDADGCNHDCRFSALLVHSDGLDGFGTSTLRGGALEDDTDAMFAVGTTVDGTASSFMVRGDAAADSWDAVSLDLMAAEEYFTVVEHDGLGGRYVGGMVRTSSLDELPTLTRLSSTGVPLWTVHPDLDVGFAEVTGIANNAGTGVVVVGTLRAATSTITRRWVAMVDLLGTQTWAWVDPSAPFAESFEDVTVGPDGTIYAAGRVSGQAGSDLNVVALDQLGGEVWRWTLDLDGGDDVLTACTIDDNGRLFVVGRTRTQALETKLVAVGLLDEGAVSWIEVTAAGGDNSALHDVTVDRQGQVVAGGRLCAPAAPACPSAHLRKYSPDGVLLWARTGAGPTFEAGTSEIHAVAANGDNEVLVVGSCRALPGDPATAWVGTFTP